MTNKYSVRVQNQQVFINKIDIFSFSIFLILVPFHFIDAEERNANVDKKNWKLVIFRTRIIHKLTASCLQLSFRLTFKFLFLQTDRQFFLFLLLYLKCKTTIQSGHSYADFSILKSEDLTNKSCCVSLSIWTF